MSARCQKENQTRSGETEQGIIVNGVSSESMLSAVIGVSNVVRWKRLREEFGCDVDDQRFAGLLLDFAEERFQRSKNTSQVTLHKQYKLSNTIHPEHLEDRTVKKRDHKHKRKKSQKRYKNAKQHPHTSEVSTNLQVFIKEDEEHFGLLPSKNQFNGTDTVKTELVINVAEEFSVPLEHNKNSKIPRLTTTKREISDVTITPIENPVSNQNNDKCKTFTAEKKPEYDYSNAPTEQTEEIRINDIKLCADNQRVAIKIKLCFNCDTRHLQDKCPLLKPLQEIRDAIERNDWLCEHEEDYKSANAEVEKNGTEHENLPLNKYSFAYLSLPKMLRFGDTNSPHGVGVYSSAEVEEFTEFGPLIGTVVKEVDISEDCNMRDVYEAGEECNRIYFSTENFAESNWLRFVRPAPSRETRNIVTVARKNLIYFVTIRRINVDEELLYWQDDVITSSKKKMEKTTCGGCNMTFLHPLYYRTHCSVFHDVRYSLTIRKYHCKVCGAAVLGKENIMKHATELHNGQGAYQCQYCKKFFLRLNYLEMHRTYGCSANPHRSRPLCDFCGRKFCQPQKLKVHIKRMHSDMSEVLKEFQCKNCMKILGSRAALQRHLKEVHQKQVDGACACSRCGKLFQNKSNLKIHMLTHSGIKPFKCTEKNCMAAFTTKQCLQFHYKKVHSFTESMMPKIERSVDYTFEAYSGADESEINNIHSNHNDSGNLDVDNKTVNNSDQEENSAEDRNTDDSTPLHSPATVQPIEQCSSSNESPATLESCAPNVKILSKGSKKWIGDDTQLYPPDVRKSEPHLDVEEVKNYTSSPKLGTFGRHESSNASLLVEAALDSVCSEPNIDIDVSTTSDALVNNLYTLSHTDALADVTYSHSVDVNDSRDIDLISPSVNDQISVTDDINDELRNTQNIGIDYSSFHQDDFSPPNTPSKSSFVRNYIGISEAHAYQVPNKNTSPSVSPPRYDFGAAVNAESDDSNGMSAQNLSLHGTKDAIQLDLSIYKSHYSFDNSNFMRKDIRSKFDDSERKQVYLAGNVEVGSENLETDLIEKDLEAVQESKHKDHDDSDLTIRTNDIRNKFDFDLDLRKSYDVDTDVRRNTYEGSLDDFRIKSYELDGLEIRNKAYENIMEDFRTDRNFDPLVLNPSELQGLDMSARSYHNYPNLNRYHHLYSDVDRTTVDLRLSYSPPPPPPPSYPDILRVVSLDLTPPGRHSVDLSLRTHQIANSRLLSEHTLQSAPHRLTLDQTRLLSTDLASARHLGGDARLISDMGNRILSDHTTNRILSNDQLPANRLLGGDQRLISDDSRLLTDQTRLLDQSRLLGDGRILPPTPANGNISPVPYSGYSVSPNTYHPTALAARPHASSPNPPSYHHYSAYY